MAGAFIITGGMQIVWRRSARARRISLRVPQKGGAPVLTLPLQVSLTEGVAFAETKVAWLAEALGRRPPPSVARFGSRIPVGGRLLALTPAPVRTAEVDGARLLLPQSRPAGPVAMAFLKHLAGQQLRASCDAHAAALGRPYASIVLRDTRSRWGSCTHDGRLMFSWRLAMAPPDVLDYVAAHEVAHLCHMDHSIRFWGAVAGLRPDYAVQRTWLRGKGSALMAWQFRNTEDGPEKDGPENGAVPAGD